MYTQGSISQLPRTYIRTKDFFLRDASFPSYLVKEILVPPYPHPFCLIFRKAARMPFNNFVCVVVDDDDDVFDGCHC